MKRKINLLPVLIMMLAIFTSGFALAEKDKEKDKEEEGKLKSSTFSGLKWRSIGPALLLLPVAISGKRRTMALLLSRYLKITEHIRWDVLQ